MMNSESFKNTVIATLEYDSKYDELRKVLLPILLRSEIRFYSQGVFTNKNGQRWENIELRVPIPLINTAFEHFNDFEKLFFYVYQEDEYYDLKEVEIRPQIIQGKEPPVENDVEFRKIQDVLIQGIRDSHFLIWVAVAWFTNDTLFHELLQKKNEGVNVRVIVSKEDSNQEMISKLQDAFDTYVIPKYGVYGNNRIHDKFCIIDLEYVMHGSYNWTHAANYNGETLVTSVDRNLVKKFATEFNSIIQGQNYSSSKKYFDFEI